MTTWIVIPNWDRYQHYGDYRQPPWIKTYTALLHDDDFQALTPAERSLLISLWLLYAMTRKRVRLDTTKLSRAIGQRVTKRTLERLNHAGFIRFSASAPLALEVEEKRKERSLEIDDLLKTPEPDIIEALVEEIQRDATEPERDPQALTRIREITAYLGYTPPRG